MVKSRKPVIFSHCHKSSVIVMLLCLTQCIAEPVKLTIIVLRCYHMHSLY